jgi:hypothetical protein
MWRSGTVSRFSDGGALEKSSRAGRARLRRRKRVVAKPAATEPAATALRLLLRSAKIKKLRRGGSANAKQHPRRDRQRNQQVF